MKPNVPSIDQLQEIALPAPVSYAPQTWGWWVLLGVLIAAALWIGGRRYWQWRQDRYRREALSRLAQLQGNGDELNALRELPELLKRVALSMPGAHAAPLGGSDWQVFLQQHCRQPLPTDFSQQLAQLAYAPEATLLAMPSQQREQLFNTCKHWVEHHHVAA